MLWYIFNPLKFRILWLRLGKKVVSRPSGKRKMRLTFTFTLTSRFLLLLFCPSKLDQVFLKNRVPQIYDIKSCDVKKKKDIWPCNMDSFFFVNFINFFLEKPSVSIIIFTTECKETRRKRVKRLHSGTTSDKLILKFYQSTKG